MTDRLYALRKSLHTYANGGYILIAVTVLAMTMANSPWRDAYFSWWNAPVSAQIGGFNLFEHHGQPMSLMQVINDALMALFFFSVGLEIKREVLVGELSSMQKALDPVVAALGGIAFPILLFWLLASDAAMLRGCAIPMATDIAFSLGVLSMFGKRVPIGLKIFLAALAVADDIGGILVIAVFYTAHISWWWLVYSFIALSLLYAGGRFLRIQSKTFYLLFGVVVWYFFLRSGIHPTISGVLVAFCIPARPLVDTRRFIEEIHDALHEFPHTQPAAGKNALLTSEQVNVLKEVESASDRVISPLQDLEDMLHPLINYLIIPLFAFANAGISLAGVEAGTLFQGIALPIWMALVVGKFAGIFLFAWLPVACRWVKRPDFVTWRMIAGVAALGGIGFTVSLFIANLSFPSLSDADTVFLAQAKLGILVGSILSGVVGYILLSFSLPPAPKE